MKIRHAKEDELNDIKNIWNYCFNDGENFVDYYFKNKYKRHNTIVVEDEGEVVSSLQLNQYKINLNNKIYNTSYVVGVSTLPQVRGRGYMKNIMKFMLKELYKRNQLVSILMPIDYRLYRKYGYEHCYDQIEYNINIEDLGNYKINGRLYKANQFNINELVDISRKFLKDINGNVERDEKFYLNLLNEIKSENGHIYIHENNGSEGYIIYFLDGETMFVREIYYKNMDSLKSMLKFIYNHNTQCKKVKISAPINDKIKFVLDNPRTCEIKVKPFMMGRIINLKDYLESLTIKNNVEGSLNILVKDNYIEQNNGVFKIQIKNNRLFVEKVNEKYNVAFNINTLTQLAFSYIDIDESILLNDLKISKRDINLLNCIFKKKSNYINEYV
ncbi:GNAT family N-acetyltransferase [Romboutsia lituseburensis]|uniref:GNAT family N-acetyltransferase n=1 Tax=Romboutsia lituseburensis TaxID=1537 RepID=UPI00215A6DDF|nr:GNAT family N-acetyltransferase [Romboutsia lituseburensis]MCR8746549.1 GNAT family N-acetyltransferase [Romboutsia lituseburensis]